VTKINSLKSNGYYVPPAFNVLKFCILTTQHACVFHIILIVKIVVSLNSINWLTFVTEM
jgi:hypothetical protein